MPPWQAISGPLAISLVPPDGHDQSFESWGEMGRWYSNLARNRRDSSPPRSSKGWRNSLPSKSEGAFLLMEQSETLETRHVPL